MTIEKRPLGRSGLSIAPLMLGGNVFGWTADEKASFAVLDAFAAGGGNAIDTADIYSAWIPGNKGGESETLIGKWTKLRGNRNQVVIATKVGMLPVDGQAGLSRKTIESAVDASLKRLQSDYIDLYFAHMDDAKTPLEETLGAFDGLLKSGKVRALGASNYSAPRLAEALAVSERNGLASYTVLQPEYNLSVRDKFEGALQNLCVERSIGVVPYYSLASGFLTGKYRTEADLAGKARGDGVRGHFNAHGLALLSSLDKVAHRHAATPAQVALSWLMAQETVAAPIASATSIEQMQELSGAMSLKLSDEDLAELKA